MPAKHNSGRPAALIQIHYCYTGKLSSSSSSSPCSSSSAAAKKIRQKIFLLNLSTKKNILDILAYTFFIDTFFMATLFPWNFHFFYSY